MYYYTQQLRYHQQQCIFAPSTSILFWLSWQSYYSIYWLPPSPCRLGRKGILCIFETHLFQTRAIFIFDSFFHVNVLLLLLLLLYYAFFAWKLSRFQQQQQQEGVTYITGLAHKNTCIIRIPFESLFFVCAIYRTSIAGLSTQSVKKTD